jgi:hypothetical protein
MHKSNVNTDFLPRRVVYQERLTVASFSLKDMLFRPTNPKDSSNMEREAINVLKEVILKLSFSEINLKFSPKWTANELFEAQGQFKFRMILLQYG